MARSSKPRLALLDIEDFDYLDRSHGLTFPQLILGVEVKADSLGEDARYPARLPRFKPGREWLRIAHRHGLRGRQQSYYLGTVLSTKNGPLISAFVGGYTAGLYDGTLTDTVDYSTDLRDMLSVGCNESWRDYDLGRYPVDLRYVADLTAERLPFNLDDLIDWNSGAERAAGSVGRWKLLILGTVTD